MKVTRMISWMLMMALILGCAAFPAGAEGEKIVLTIVGAEDFIGSNTRILKAAEAFEAENPGYTVKLTRMPKDVDVLAAVAEGQEGYDILALDETNTLGFKLSGNLYDFSENAVIAENLSQYIDMPFLWEADGRLYGMPVFVQPLIYRATVADLEAVQLDIPAEWTWEEFFALADEARAKDRLFAMSMLDANWARRQYHCVYSDFFTGSLNYDTNAFRTLAEGWKELDDYNWTVSGKLPNAVLNESYIWWSGDFMEMEPIVDISLPYMDGKRVTPVEVKALYANKNGAHLDAVIRFMEIYSSKEVQKEFFDGQNGAFLPDLTEYAMYEMFSQFDNYIPTEEEFAAYTDAIATGCQIYIDKEFESTERKLFTQFVRDDITLDELVVQLQEAADARFAQ